MSDTCYLDITIRKVDLPIWDAVFAETHHQPDSFLSWLNDHEERANGLIWGSADEANYGWETELQAAAEKGAVFAGEHGLGGNYLAGCFCGVDGAYYHHYTNLNGRYILEVGNAAEPDPDDQQYLRMYVAAEQRAYAALGLELP